MLDVRINDSFEFTRNLLYVLLNHVKNNYNLSKEDAKEVINCLIEYYSMNRSGYEANLNKINWLDINLSKEITKLNIDINYYYINCSKEFLVLDSALTKSNTFYNKNYYDKLCNDVKSGIIYTKKDLTYEILYELRIIENIPDSLIGDLFNLKKSQVKYLRQKYNLNNVFLNRIINNPNRIFENIDNYSELKKMSKFKIMYIYYQSVFIFCKSKNWNIQTANNYLEERIDNNSEDYELVTYYLDKRNIQRKEKNIGRNYELENKTKKDVGDFGELMVCRHEKKKLKEKGLIALANQVDIISKTLGREITHNGKGYDIVSYNNIGDKIYIEVKTSITNYCSTKFFLTNKEYKVISGDIKEIDKKKCFIYYVYNINDEIRKANLRIINYKKLKNLNMKPLNYLVYE